MAGIAWAPETTQSPPQATLRPTLLLRACLRALQPHPSLQIPNLLHRMAVAVSTLSILALSLRSSLSRAHENHAMAKPGLTYARVSTAAQNPFQLPPDGKRTPHVASHGVNNTSSSELAQTVYCVFAQAVSVSKRNPKLCAESHFCIGSSLFR